MTRDLSAEIATYLKANGPSTASEICLGIRARRSEVMARLVRGAVQVARPDGGNPRATYYDLSRTVPQPQGHISEGDASTRSSQNGRVLACLSDGKPHTTAEIHVVAGFCRLNSRIAELRSRGYVIETHRIDGVPAGPHAQAYQLLATPTEAIGDAA